MKICVYQSGSSGNCTLIRTNKLNILIDCGISKKSLLDNLCQSNLELNDIDYIFFTHEHTDHIKSFNIFLKSAKIKIFISEGTLNYIYADYYNHGKNKECEMINNKLKYNDIIVFNRIKNSILYEPLYFDELKITPLPIFHDANEPVGFMLEEDNKKLTYITDTGYVHSDLFDIIKNSDCFLLESNHDPEILMASSRPYFTKIRISGDHGHLSNEDSMYILTRVIGENTKVIMHAHVSEECNLKEIIKMTRKRVFESYGLDDSKYKCITLEPRRCEEIEI